MKSRQIVCLRQTLVIFLANCQLVKIKRHSNWFTLVRRFLFVFGFDYIRSFWRVPGVVSKLKLLGNWIDWRGSQILARRKELKNTQYRPGWPNSFLETLLLLLSVCMSVWLWSCLPFRSDPLSAYNVIIIVRAKQERSKDKVVTRKSLENKRVKTTQSNALPSKVG